MDIGWHISINSFTKDLKLIRDSGCNFVQIFTRNPRTNYANSKLVKEFELVDLMKSLLDHCNSKLVIHAPYILNFCKDNKESRESLKEDLKIIESFGQVNEKGVGVVVHLGKNVNNLEKSESFKLMCDQLSTVISETSDLNSKILIETSCGQGTEICHLLEDLSELLNLFKPEIKKRIGICVDTAHIFAAGYNISTKEGTIDYLTKFDELIGNEYFQLLHLNDSKKTLGSRVDRHEIISKGEIYKSRNEGLQELLKFVKKNKIPIVLETGIESLKPVQDCLSLTE